MKTHSSPQQQKHQYQTVKNKNKKTSSLMATLLQNQVVVLVLLQMLFVIVLSDPSDESCLTGLHASLEDPNGNLRNWSRSNFASPCNGFTSSLPGATCNNGRIFKLSLPNLYLSGTLSPSLSNCTSLQSLDLSSNSISGIIPTSISFLLNLAVLNLSSNSLSGEIPPQLALCAYLNVIDLHSNKLTGQIPEQLSFLPRLSAFNVSNNELEGPIPPLLSNRTATGLPRFNISSFAGNKGLYGYPLPPKNGKGLSVLAIVGIGLASGLLSLVLSFTAVCIWLKATPRDNFSGADEGKMSQFMPDY